jgi:outer membrane lipoprotein-sorting protein
MHMMRRIALSVLAVAVAVAASAWAAPKETVHDAFAKFLAAKSFRATVTDAKSGEQISEMEFVAPDRYHMRSGKGPETIIIGDAAYMNMNGQLMKMPIPVGKIVGQYRNESMQKFENIVVTDLGVDNVGGEAAHRYGYTVTEPAKADVKLWISDRTGMPLQIESQGTFMGHASTARVRYSDFNDPSISIAAP